MHKAHEQDGLNPTRIGDDFPDVHNDLMLLDEAILLLFARSVLRVVIGKEIMAFVRRLVIVEILIVRKRSRAKGATRPKIRSLAVLPLKNLSGGATQEYLADGMTEAAR